MQASLRPYVLASAGLVATSAVLMAPFAPKALQLPIGSQPPVRSAETKLVDAGIENIPINLFDDILNIPSNEIQALDTGAASLFNTGTWWVPSSTNIWGVDPGDTTHVAGILGFLPFPGLTQGVGGLDYQIDGLGAAELPVSASCDAATCAPITPPEVVTGSASFDRLIGFLEAGTGQQEFGLFDNWFRVPISDLISGYQFTEANDPGVIDPSGSATQQFGFPLDGGSNPFEGGTTQVTLPDGTIQDQMPWYDLTYHFNLLQPFENFYNSLLADPSTAGIGGTGVELPTIEGLFQGLQNGAAGLVIDFDPFIAGSPACPAMCDIPTSLQIPALVEDIAKLDPNNTTIPAWLAANAAGTANEPTQSQTYEAIALLQTGEYNLTAEQLATIDANLASINPELPTLYTNAGILTDPGYLAYTEATASTTTGANSDVPFEPVYGGDNTNLIGQDLLALLTNNSTDYNELSNPAAFASLVAPGLIVSDPGLFATSAADPGAAAVGGFDPSSVMGDASTLSALLGVGAASTLSADLTALMSQISAELSAAMTADLATSLPTALASLF